VNLGERFGPYDILGVLGQGGMGVVYRARDSRLGREVALKTLPAPSAADPARVQRFEQEAQAASSMNHPNVLSVFDAGQLDGTPYIVTELLEGQTLRERLQEDGPVPHRKAIELTVAIAQGLSAVHEKGVVHRDLKPENVFVTRDGRVKILDFGVARMLELSTPGNGTLPLTQEGAVMGTAGYMSPEQVRGRPADARSDVFAVGCILYELVTGRPAFDGETPVERGYAILNQDPPPLSPPSPGLERVISRCLEKAPEQRFQDARDLAFALEAVTDLSSRAGVSSAPGGSRASGASSTTRLPWVIAGLSGIVAVVLAGAAVVGPLLKPAPASVPPGAVGVAAPRFTRVSFRSGWVSGARFTGDKGVVYSGGFEGEPSQVVTGAIGSATTRPLGVPGAELYDVSRGGELALGVYRLDAAKKGSRGPVLSRVSLSGGTPRPLMENVIAAAFGPGDAMMVVRRVGARFALEYPAGHELVSRPWAIMARLSPDGARIAWVDAPVAGDDRGSVVMTDSEGRELARSRTFWSVSGLAWGPEGREVWFTAADTGVLRTVRALSEAGNEREIFAAPGSLVLFDIDAGGRLLVAMQLSRLRIFGRVGGTRNEEPLSYFSGSIPVDLAADGSSMLFIEGHGSEVSEIETYLRRFDGSPPVRLAGGHGRALSPDQKWVVVSPTAPFSTLSLVPTGPGAVWPLPPGRFSAIHRVRFFADGKRVLISALGTDGKSHLYVQDVTAGLRSAGSELGLGAEGEARSAGLAPRLVSEAELFALAPPSPDGTRLAARSPDGVPVMVDVETGAAKPIAGLELGDSPVQWTSDGRGLVIARRPPKLMPLEIELLRFDLATRSLTKVWDVGPSDTVGVPKMEELLVTPDASRFVFEVHQVLDELYVIEGLR
jgi:hypothetical protein